MTTLSEQSINTLNQYTKFIEKRLTLSSDKTLWYRGSGNNSHKLIPSLFRHPNIVDPQKIIELETKIMDRFNQRSIPFLNQPFDKSDDWGITFFMQHYRIPTRLLDWSENPFIALYFALTNSNSTEDSCVWILDPVAWNKESLKDFSYSEGVLSIEDTLISSFKPRTPFTVMRENPIAIFGTHNSPRIVTQRGVFTIFGKKISPIEDIYTSCSFPQDCLIKLRLPKNKINSLLTSLISIGTTDSVVYPDLEGFALELKRFFKFKI